MNKMFILIVLLSSGCATPLNEHNRYLKIKSLLAQEKYSGAGMEIFKLEKDYPQSEYLCELWNVQIAYFKDKNTAATFVKETEEKRNKRCNSNSPEKK